MKSVIALSVLSIVSTSSFAAVEVITDDIKYHNGKPYASSMSEDEIILNEIAIELREEFPECYETPEQLLPNTTCWNNAINEKQEKPLIEKLDFNVMAGVLWNNAGDMTAPSTALEVIYDDKYLVGAQYSWKSKDWSNEASFYIPEVGMVTNIGKNETKTNYASLYGGYFITDSIALKLGYTKETSKTDGKSYDKATGNYVGGWNNDFDVDFVMLGASYHYKNFNANLHFNRALSTSVKGFDNLNAYNNWSLLLGYKF